MENKKQHTLKEAMEATETYQYQQKRAAIAIAYAPRIMPCAFCLSPYIVGYCCNSCGSMNPSDYDKTLWEKNDEN
jgi:hypothetical protein